MSNTLWNSNNLYVNRRAVLVCKAAGNDEKVCCLFKNHRRFRNVHFDFFSLCRLFYFLGGWGGGGGWCCLLVLMRVTNYFLSHDNWWSDFVVTLIILTWITLLHLLFSEATQGTKLKTHCNENSVFRVFNVLFWPFSDYGGHKLRQLSLKSYFWLILYSYRCQ